MVGSIDQRGPRFHCAMLAICVALFAYMLGVLTITVQLGNDYSVLQWIVVGALVLGSAALLTYQVRKLRFMVEDAQHGMRRDDDGGLVEERVDDAER